MLLFLGFMGLSIAFVAFGVTYFFVENKRVCNSRQSRKWARRATARGG